jgi:hypothetical protein
LRSQRREIDRLHRSIDGTDRSMASEINSCSVAVRVLSVERVVPQPTSASNPAQASAV